MTSAGVKVLLDLRDRWAERGVDWWSADPTSRPGSGWVTVEELAADHELLADLITQWGSAHQIDQRKAAASLFVKRLGSILAFPPTVAWMSWRRVPVVHPAITWLRFDGGEPARLAFTDPVVAVDADDPLADSHDAIITTDLLDHLWQTAYDATMGAVIGAVHETERTGRRHLWGNLGLTAVNSALWSAPRTSAWDDGLALIERDERLARTIEALPAHRPDTDRFIVALRKTCCMAYADEDHGYCASCSLLDRDERIDDLTCRIGDAWRDRTG